MTIEIGTEVKYQNKMLEDMVSIMSLTHTEKTSLISRIALAL